MDNDFLIIENFMAQAGEGDSVFPEDINSRSNGINFHAINDDHDNNNKKNDEFGKVILIQVPFVSQESFSGSVGKNVTSKFVKATNKLPKKKHYCYFCQSKIDKLSNHLRFHHLNEKEVKEIHSEKNQKTRLKMIAALRKKGDFRRFEVLARCGMDERIRVRKGLKEGLIKPCPRCKGFYSARLLSKHKCEKENWQKGRAFINESNFLVAKKKSVEDEDDMGFASNILSQMRDDCREECLADQAVMKFGRLIYEPVKPERMYQIVRTRMRYLVKLKRELNIKLGTQHSSIAVFINTKIFDRICTAVIELAKKDKTTMEHGSVAIVYGEIIKTLTQSLIAEELKKDNRQEQSYQAEKQYREFLDLFNIEWKQRVTKSARYVMKIRKNEAQDNMIPLQEDIKKFNEGLNIELDSACSLLKEEKTEWNWRTTCQLLLVKVTTFNVILVTYFVPKFCKTQLR